MNKKVKCNRCHKIFNASEKHYSKKGISQRIHYCPECTLKYESKVEDMQAAPYSGVK